MAYLHVIRMSFVPSDRTAHVIQMDILEGRCVATKLAMRPQNLPAVRDGRRS